MFDLFLSRARSWGAGRRETLGTRLQIDNGCQDFHTIDVTQHEKTITTSSVGKRSLPKRLFPRNRQKGMKNKTDKILTGPLGLLA